MTLAPFPEVYLVLPAPVPASRARSNGARRFHAEPYAAWRGEAAVMLLRQWNRPPLRGPVDVSSAFIFARPGDRPKWCPREVWASGARFRRAVGADIDNLDKAVRDAIQVPAKPLLGMISLRKLPPDRLTGYVIWDDSAVVSGASEKWVASATETARTVVRVRAVGWTE